MHKEKLHACRHTIGHWAYTLHSKCFSEWQNGNPYGDTLRDHCIAFFGIDIKAVLLMAREGQEDNLAAYLVVCTETANQFRREDEQHAQSLMDHFPGIWNIASSLVKLIGSDGSLQNDKGEYNAV